jgi:hypothetical protein
VYRIIDKFMSDEMLRWLKKNKFKIIIFLFLTLIPVSIVYYTYIFEPPATKEDIAALERLIEEKFEDFDIEIGCEEFKKPIVERGAVYVDKCVYMSQSLSLGPEQNSIGATTHFSSDWGGTENDIHYILNIYDQSDEIIVFEEDNKIKMKIASENAEIVLKMPLKDVEWKDQAYSDEWNSINISWNGCNKELLLEVNGFRKTVSADIEISPSNATLILGASKDKTYFAEGWFDDIRVFDPTVLEGSVTSSLKDAEYFGGVGEVWKQIKFYGSIPEGTSIAIDVNTSGDNITWSGWQLVQSNASSGIAYDIPSSYQKRYGQFRIKLQSTNPFLSPVLHNVTFISGAS